MRFLFIAPILGAILLFDCAYSQVSLDLMRPKPRGGLFRREFQSIDLLIAPQWPGNYRIQLKVGNPGQFISVGVTTMSMDSIWVPGSNTSTCEDTRSEIRGPCSFGGFDPSSSRTFKPSKKPFYADHGKNMSGAELFVEGFEFKDDIKLGDMSLSNFTMGYAENVTTGLVPLFSLLYTEGRVRKEESLLYQLWFRGHIPTLGYSIWLSSQSATDGQVYLGGIDTSKYDGDLVSFETSPGILELPLTSLSASSSSGTDKLVGSNLPLSIALAMGSGWSVFPQDLAFEIWAVAGVRYLAKDTGWPLIPCSRRKSQGFFTLEFGGEKGVKINMTMSELVFDEDILDSVPNADEPLCVFGILNATNDISYKLGEGFFRSAYVAVDLHNEKVAIAPVRMDADSAKSEVIAFNGNGAPIPSATALSNQPIPTDQSSYEPSIKNWNETGKSYKASKGFSSLKDGNPASNDSSSGGDGNSSGGLSTGSQAGIGVGVGLGALVVGLGIFLVMRRGRKAKHEPTATVAGQNWTAKPELSGDGVSHKALNEPHELHSPDDHQAAKAIPVAPVEIGGREIPAEAYGDVKNR
ncbi:hypothetical protein FDECE_1044 [Fusarium decemcellulare]|nr:hypothetical protein FDECE_1044 [Fusarium decemcellulare]